MDEKSVIFYSLRVIFVLLLRTGPAERGCEVFTRHCESKSVRSPNKMPWRNGSIILSLSWLTHTACIDTRCFRGQRYGKTGCYTGVQRFLTTGLSKSNSKESPLLAYPGFISVYIHLFR